MGKQLKISSFLKTGPSNHLKIQEKKLVELDVTVQNEKIEQVVRNEELIPSEFKTPPSSKLINNKHVYSQEGIPDVIAPTPESHCDRKKFTRLKKFTSNEKKHERTSDAPVKSKDESFSNLNVEKTFTIYRKRSLSELTDSLKNAIYPISLNKKICRQSENLQVSSSNGSISHLSQSEPDLTSHSDLTSEPLTHGIHAIDAKIDKSSSPLKNPLLENFLYTEDDFKNDLQIFDSVLNDDDEENIIPGTFVVGKENSSIPKIKMVKHSYKTCLPALPDHTEKDKSLDFQNQPCHTSPKTLKESERSSPQTFQPFLNSLGRHLIKDFEYSEDKSEKQLLLWDESSQTEKRCILRDFWKETLIQKNDYVNVLASFNNEETAIINNKEGFLIVHPDHLVTGTAVVGSLFCMRKAVLSEKFKGTEPANFSMVCGSLIHQIFQEVIQKNINNINGMKMIANKILQQTSNLHAIYGAKSNEKDVTEEIHKYLPRIKEWADLYMVSESNGKLQIVGIEDIEENIWSPRFGIKGKVDLTVEVKIHKNSSKKMIPLELKTGRSSFSAEHQGQVILYTMLCSDRRQDPGEGLLLYLKDGQMKLINADHDRKRDLIQLRNELVHFLKQKAIQDPQSKQLVHPSLPAPIDDNRNCQRCSYLTTCAVYQRINPLNLKEEHTMKRLVPSSTLHLNEDHLKYFSRWILLLELELQMAKTNALNSIYCQSSEEREKLGEGFTQMNLDMENYRENMNGFFVMNFSRCPSQTISSCKHLDEVGISVGDRVIISCENSKEFAISTGTILRLTNTMVQVEMDKNLSSIIHYQDAVFRLDRFSSGSIISTLSMNLAQLMEDAANSKRLRQLIIEKRRPNFLDGLKKEYAMKGRPFLKGLNRKQIQAVFRVFMTQDYLLIKGMPGTGKTSTIIALIRMLEAFDYSILITSYTHSAIDNILLKLQKHNVDFVRVGHLNRIHKNLTSYAVENLVANISTVKELEDFYNSKRIVATTCLGLSHPLFNFRHFDFCIVDEASQVLQPACLGPLLHASRFILIGDPKQLPPIVQNKEARQSGMEESLLSHLDSPGAYVELNIQYRMNREIMRIANKLMYENALECGSDTIARATLSLMPFSSPVPSWASQALSPCLEDSVVFLNTDDVPAEEKVETRGISNIQEAEIIECLVQLMIKGGVDQNDVGIISPYRNQILLISDRFKQQPLLKNIEINTVDQYQGRDKSIILLSCVRSTKTSELGEILHDFRRLNVAITRAKHKLIIVGNRNTLQHYLPFKKLFDILLLHQIINLPQDCLEH